ncbi:polysaccharide biosynthesis tyrosine autokinase [Ornithinimicrobium ciconiae]|uniref:non-specific protein-tyrosine kinase n=1 Tax=Ornithinimicrobium ciconiae TaxID=2594265 RepID=A0A516G6Q6_9MICO|nr:polysaccharide biosynthesis tyrosine autokinase [Ornithinimicrobium ciconiae]QDO87204.1 polysaccharide biosynthesis tyrosine autokinase [Ornithinimicrobium ciconiae]
MQINELLAILRTRWRIIVATILAVVSVAAVITLQTPPTYQAHTRVYLSAQGDQGSVNMYQMPTAELSTILEVAQSPVVLTPVQEQLGLEPGQILSVNAAAETGTPLIDINVSARTPEAAAEVATAVANKLAEVSPDFSQMLAASGGEVQAQTIVAASPPGSPSSPNVARNLALALLAGLFLGIGFALLRHNLDTRVRTAQDLADMSGHPVLATIPLRKGGDEHQVFMETDPFGSHAEAIRRLRTNLMFVDVTTRKHSFLVTSPMPSEGKTTTAVNLALAMADAGTKVVLVDADLRHPSVAKTMELEGGVGLTTVLLGRATLDDMLIRWGRSDLYILPAGEIPPNPSELLGSEAMHDLFVELRERFDFVLVDTPPVLPVTDATVVDKLTGGSLMVVAANRTRKRHVAEALRTFEMSGATLAGTALNMAPVDTASYYGYYRQEMDANGGDTDADEQTLLMEATRPRSAARSRARR